MSITCKNCGGTGRVYLGNVPEAGFNGYVNCCVCIGSGMNVEQLLNVIYGDDEDEKD